MVNFVVVKSSQDFYQDYVTIISEQEKMRVKVGIYQDVRQIRASFRSHKEESCYFFSTRKGRYFVGGVKEA